MILSGENQQAIATGIALIGNDVYVIGERRNLDWATFITSYWKNGQLFDLTDRSVGATYQAITVSGSDLYLLWSETYNNSGQSQTRYSKNLGAPTLINDGTPDVTGNSITVNGNDVYVAGYGTGNGSNVIRAKYWKNGLPVVLSNEPESTFGFSIAVSGSDVYVGGSRDGGANGGSGTAQYWKNGNVVSLSNGSQAADIRKIVVVRK